jgi:hypothetical protein
MGSYFAGFITAAILFIIGIIVYVVKGRDIKLENAKLKRRLEEVNNELKQSANKTLSDSESDDLHANKKTDLAYQTNFTIYKQIIKGEKYLCYPKDIIDARLYMLEFWFWPHLYNNRFQEHLMERENIIHSLQVDYDYERKKNKRKNKLIFGFTAGGLTLGTIGGFILGFIVAK